MNLRRDVFQAIADPTRRAILGLLALGSCTPNAIAENFDSTRQTISKHLQILAECKLVTSKQKGREVYYSFNPKRMKEVFDWAEQFRELWEGRFDRMEKIIKGKNGAI